MIDLTIIIGYLVLTLIVGIYSGRNIKDMRDYSVGSKGFSTPILVATVSATWVGAEDILGLTEQVFKVGIIYVTLPLGMCFSLLIVAKFIAPRMRQFDGMISVGEMMGSFYGKCGRIVTGLAGAIMETGFVGAQIISIGVICHLFMNTSYTQGILIASGVVVLYSSFGGIRAVTMTDVLQFIALIVAIPMICNVGLNKVGGYRALFSLIPETHQAFIPIGENPWNYLALFFVFCLPKLSPAISQRLLMVKDWRQRRHVMYISALCQVPLIFITLCIGLIALVLAPNIEPFMATPYLINNILPVGIKGLAVVGLLAVTMSTADSDLNAASITLVHDVIKPIAGDRLSDRTELRLTQWATAFLGCGAMAAAINFQSIIDLILASFNLWSPIVLVPLYCGIFGVKASGRSFACSLLTGALVFFTWKYKIQPITGIAPLVPSLLGNAIGFFGSYKVLGSSHKKHSTLKAESFSS